MINFKQAQKLILSFASASSKEVISLNYGNGRVLTADLLAPISHPPFDQSAVDGYALKYKDIVRSRSCPLQVVGEVKAGDSCSLIIKNSQAARIFTGSPLPEGADTIVMQEMVQRDLQTITIIDHQVKKGAHIRKKAEQINKGSVALKKGRSE